MNERISDEREWYTEERIIGPLRQHETGVKAASLCGEHGISKATLYNRKSKHSDLDGNGTRRLWQMKDANRRLKQLVADMSLDSER